MGGTVLFSIGARALAANYAALQTTGHNIANANVEGYSRQRVELQTSLGQFTGSGFFGRGVDVATVVRSYDEFLTREAATSKALAAGDTARLTQLRQLEQVFKTGEQGLGHATSQFLNSMSDLASRPADTATRQVVLSRADEIAQRYSEASAQIETVQRGTNESMQLAVDAVNAFARSIAEVNGNIAAARGLGQPANDLLDQRDRLISQLSEHVQVTTIAASDGTLGVFMGGGQRLVLGDRAERLQLTSDRFDPSRAAVAMVDGTALRRLTADALGSGSIAGLLRFQDNDLVAARSLLGQMASALAGAVNVQQQLGLNLRPPVGTLPSQAMFAVGAPAALPASTNAKDAGGAFIGNVTLTVADGDAQLLQASEYKLAYDGAAGRWQLTRLSDGLKRLVDSGDTVDGMRIDIAGAAVTDQFLLQPVARAAGTMRALLADPRDVAAASPLVASTATANTGTARVAELTMIAPPLDPQATAQVTFGALDPTDPSGRRRLYSWTLTDAASVVIGSGSGSWAPGQTLPAPPDPEINGFRLALSGVPNDLDVVTVEPTPYPEANNGNAIALAALRDGALVGRTLLADGSLAGGDTFNEAYVGALADVGVRTQGAQSSASMSSALATQTAAARAGQAGVNLDEEAARLIQFQQSYQAAAKILQVAQSVFDTLLDTARG